MPQSKVIARMTVRRPNQLTIIVEVQADATFHSFYRFYTQEGRRWSTKRLVRTASRNEGLHPYHRAYRMTPGLEQIAARMPGGDVQIRILLKRAYRKLTALPADELGLTRTRVRPSGLHWTPTPAAIPVYDLVRRINQSKMNHVR